jgi:hypothetical protein
MAAESPSRTSLTKILQAGQESKDARHLQTDALLIGRKANVYLFICVLFNDAVSSIEDRHEMPIWYVRTKRPALCIQYHGDVL